MKKIFLSLAFFSLAFSSSCSTRKDFAEPFVKKTNRYPTKKVFAYSYSAVWEATSSAITGLSIPVNLSRRDQGLVTTDWQVEKSDQLFSGYGETKIPYKVRYKMKLEIRPTKKGILVNILSREQYLTDAVTAGKDFNGSIYQWVDIKSSGSKESQLLNAISDLLNGSARNSAS